MVLVDTSVWIELLRGTASPGTLRLEDLIRGHNRAAICGVILQEILQGIRDDTAYHLTRQRLLFFPFLESGKDVHLLAASLYRDLRKDGVTVPSADALIAAVALSHAIPILTADQHFAVIAARSPLELLA